MAEVLYFAAVAGGAYYYFTRDRDGIAQTAGGDAEMKFIKDGPIPLSSTLLSSEVLSELRSGPNSFSPSVTKNTSEATYNISQTLANYNSTGMLNVPSGPAFSADATITDTGSRAQKLVSFAVDTANTNAMPASISRAILRGQSLSSDFSENRSVSNEDLTSCRKSALTVKKMDPYTLVNYARFLAYTKKPGGRTRATDDEFYLGSSSILT